jgi:hypothetical protein
MNSFHAERKQQKNAWNKHLLATWEIGPEKRAENRESNIANQNSESRITVAMPTYRYLRGWRRSIPRGLARYHFPKREKSPRAHYSP